MSSVNSRDESIISFYNDVFGANANKSNANLVGWVGQEDQYVRFKILMAIGVKDQDSLLDYGCGLGDFVTYLSERYPFLDIDYTGMDINEKFIAKARQAHPDSKFIVGDLPDLDGTYDWIIGSGVFTILTPLKEILYKINLAHDKCRKGIAFNFLLSKPPYTLQFNKYNPKVLYRMVKRLLPKAELITGYAHDDFTIYVKK